MHPYKNSGAIPLVRGVLCAVAILIVALLFGVANAYCVHWSPVNGVVFFLCIPLPFAVAFSLGCSGVCGWLVGKLLHWGKIRNRAYEYGAIGGAALAYLYAEWSAAQGASGWLPIGWRSWLPDASLAFAQALVARDGSLMIVAWVVDALMIAALIALLVRSRAQPPFCERCDAWTKLQTGYLLFPGRPLDDVWVRFRQGDFGVLRTIPLLQARSQTYMRLDLASCPYCPASRYLAIRALYPSAFSGDQPVEELFVPFQELSAEEFAELRQLAGEMDPA